MSTATENDLKELRDLINSKFESINQKIESKFERVFEEFTVVKVEIATLKEGQNNLNKRLDETKDALSKRLDNLEFIARSVIGSILIALLLGLAKILYPNLLG